MARYMMATKAIHKMGDVSSRKPTLCIISGEDDENYIGNWVLGLGLINVKFPKSTTRELTDEEKAEWNGRQIENGCDVVITIRIGESE